MAKNDLQKKEFKFTIKNRKGKVLVEEIVGFGSDEYPFPKNWKKSGMAMKAIMDYKEEMFRKHFTIEVSEDLSFTLDSKYEVKDDKK